MQLIADRIKDLSAQIHSYSDQFNAYTKADMACLKCRNQIFNLLENCYEENCHYAILLECLECKHREVAFDNMIDGYDGTCIFRANNLANEEVKTEKLISAGEVRISFAYSLEFDEIVKTAEIHNTNVGNLFCSILFEMRHAGSPGFQSVWDTETA